MTWVTWRLYRSSAVLAAALLAALAVLLVITGLHAASVWHAALAGCGRAGTCAALPGSDLSLGSAIITALVLATAAVPLIPGLFWGAPLVAHELEAGTNQFAWTQSVTRRRWLAVRAGWLLAASAAVAGITSALVTWWSGPYTALKADAFAPGHFDITGIVPAGYAIFAAALGICAGALLRRTIPALAVTLAGFAALRVITSQWARLHYLTPLTIYSTLTSPLTPKGSYLTVAQGIIPPPGAATAAAANAPAYDGVPLPAACLPAAAGPHPSPLACLAAHGYRDYLTYQPASRYWPFQGIETGIFLTLAALLLAITFWTINHRDA
jgi:hypothetical protein